MFRPHADTQVSEVDGELMIVDTRNDKVHCLNPTAAFIWNRLDGKLSEEELATDVAANFSVDVDVARKDLRALLVEFYDLGLLEEIESQR